MTAKDIFNLKKLPKSMTIIGAGAIGIEFAYFFNALGTRVTLLEAKENILPNEDVEVSQWMHKVLKRKKVDIQTGTMATEINDEYILVSIGVEGNSSGFGLKKIGIEIGSNNHIIVDKNGKTNLDNIYAVGDVIGPPWLAHVSSSEGLYVVEHIAKLSPKKIDYDCVPACTYSKPEIGSIGLSQKILDERGIDYKVVKSFFNANGKAVASDSTEGFIRQLIGWREFIRGIYIAKGSFERTNNYWGFKSKIPKSFYDGTTGIEPLDSSIKKVSDTGYIHHIERLMIVGNFMLLCEFDPDEVYRWFMEVSIDSFDWVMVPNVYGMSQFADGGMMSTKPYISSSNYILKMSDYKKGDWCEIWDALYWNFINENRDFFRKNPRTSMMINMYDKKSKEVKNNYLNIEKDLQL